MRSRPTPCDPIGIAQLPCWAPSDPTSPDKCTVRFRAGDVLRMLTPGGGGWAGPNSSVDRSVAASGGHPNEQARVPIYRPETRWTQTPCVVVKGFAATR
jgi:hypothetical protein